MKIERINDNQIRCTLNKEDLEGKETLLNELAFGSGKAKELFRELMNKASAELGFETNDIPLMVEAIPVSKECLILVITRVDDPEEFSSHYKKISKNVAPENIHIAPDSSLLDFLNGGSDSPLNEQEDSMNLALADPSMSIYCFRTLEDVAVAARLVKHHTTTSSLYKDPLNQSYYLTIHIPSDSGNSSEMEEIHSVLSEYCRRLPNTYATKALFNEHLNTIIKIRAIEEMAEY